MNEMQKKFLAAGAALVVLFLLWELWAAPFLLMNMDLRDQQVSGGVQELWVFPEGEEGPYFVDVRQVETIVEEAPEKVVINSTYIEIDPLTGELSWGHEEIVAIGKATRMHTSGGDVERSGYAAFPLHVGKRDYEIWYRHLLGKGVWHFERESVREGLPVYVFSYKVVSNATKEYPEWAPHEVVVEDTGEMEVEPASGMVVNWVERWEGYVIKDGGRELIDVWTGAFYRSTIMARAGEAAERKSFIFIVEWIVPAMLAGLALLMGLLSRIAKEEAV
ncbi:MAG: porin PorA family protein [Candidatus Micrarchaeota archaeon]